MTPRVIVTDAVGVVAGRWLMDAIEAVTTARGRCRLAIPGGTAPVPVFEWLAEHLPRSLVERLVVTWVDERHLPLPASTSDWRALPDDGNLRLAWAHWFSRAAVVPTLVSMARPEALAQAARRCSEDFAVQLDGRLDVVLLGAGPDGHIASLFPGHPALERTAAAEPCVAVPDSPKPPPQRLSLTLPVLEAVEHALLVASGEAKAAMLRRAYAGDDSIPLGRYRPRGAWTWVLDPAAAAALPSTCYEQGSQSEET
ncbi:6-phosphogluconolactonase [Paraliomyxa miuraensis]|nr:6-phosphogluconolactonase [Paraliomyxa miuraensis]